MLQQENIWSVSELTHYVKNLLQGDDRLRHLWVGGEISNFTHHRSGHMYFRLKDSSSSMRCVFFRRENRACSFTPENGMAVLLNGSISVYEPDGAYQFYVSAMEPAGMGSLHLAYEQLKARLEKEGLFDPLGKRPLPYLPRKIALLTSPSGAALQDMLTAFQRSYPSVILQVVECQVQGAGAAADIADALEAVNRRGDTDLVILARGGGSLEDLWAYNEEILARAIYKSTIPVISAVGHQTDYTIADFVADARAPTPTAAVNLLPNQGELIASLKSFRERLCAALGHRVRREKQLLDYLVGERFWNRPRLRLEGLQRDLEMLEARLLREMERFLAEKKLVFKGLVEKLDSYSPLKVMERGYSFCRDERGRVIRSVKDLHPGLRLELALKDGRAFCQVESLEEGKAGES